MEDKTIILSSAPIEVADGEDSTCKYATFLISVLDEYDRRGRKITQEAGEQFHETLRGCPIVTKLIRDRANRPVDFAGHEVRTWKKRNGDIETTYGTYPIGSVVDTWIETREVDGYDGEKACIMAKAKLWTERYPEYFTVFDRLWNEGQISSSWEIKASDIEQEPSGHSILKAFTFIGNAVLGTGVIPAVKGAGVYEYAEDEREEICNSTEELIKALLKDIDNDITEQEEQILDEKEKKIEPETDEMPEQENDTKPTDEAKAEQPEEQTDEKPADDEADKEKKEAAADTLEKRVEDLSAALIQANAVIQELRANIESLEPFKAQMEQIEQERAAAEREKQVATLRQLATDSKLFSESELNPKDGDDTTVADMIAAADEAGIKDLIVKRVVSAVNGPKRATVAVASIVTRKPDLNKTDTNVFTSDTIVSAYINRRRKDV